MIELTVADMWRMVIQFKVKNVVMLCGLTEEGKNKCHQYWDVLVPVLNARVTRGVVTATRLSAAELTPSLIRRDMEVVLYNDLPDRVNGCREFHNKWYSPVASTRVC